MPRRVGLTFVFVKIFNVVDKNYLEVLEKFFAELVVGVKMRRAIFGAFFHAEASVFVDEWQVGLLEAPSFFAPEREITFVARVKNSMNLADGLLDAVGVAVRNDIAAQDAVHRVVGVRQF